MFDVAVCSLLRDDDHAVVIVERNIDDTLLVGLDAFGNWIVATVDLGEVGVGWNP